MESSVPPPPKKIQDFSSENYNKKIASLTDDILHKKYPEEDQLLIYITTHANLSASGTYQILTTDQVANAEALQKLMLAAEKMHVKLAIVDQTCYSGKILNTLTPHVCFISGSHADQIAFTGDGNHLVSEIAESSKETNLEDIYLKARLRGSLTHMASQPQISTPAGQATDALLAPFKNSISTKEDLLAHFQKFTCRNTMIGVSDLEGQLKELQVLINQNLQDQTAFKKNHELFEALKKQTEQYSYLYAQVSDALVAGDLEYCVVENRSLPNNCRTISNYEKLFKDGTDAAQQFCKKDPKSQKCSTLSFYQKLYSDLKKSSAYQRYQELTSSKAKLLSDIESLSAKIADNEKVLYDRVYKQFLKKTKGPNPCRDFKI